MDSDHPEFFRDTVELDAVARFMQKHFRQALPKRSTILTPDVIVYTWVCAFEGLPFPMGKETDRADYSDKLLKQAEAIETCLHVLFYSRWRMTNETELLRRMKHHNLVLMCLEDHDDIFPTSAYTGSDTECIRGKFHDTLHYMDYLRQLAMSRATAFRNRAFSLCSKRVEMQYNGNALMYADIDVDFIAAPRQWIAPNGMLTCVYPASGEDYCLLRQNPNHFDTMATSDVVDLKDDMKSDSNIVMVGYGQEAAFTKAVSRCHVAHGGFPEPRLGFSLFNYTTDMMIAMYQQARCIRIGRHRLYVEKTRFTPSPLRGQ